MITNEYSTLNKELNVETQELADKMISGNITEREKNRLVNIIYPKLKYYIFKFFNDNDHTLEALHNTIEKIFKNFDQYDNNWKFTTWIYNIAKNEALLYKHNLNKVRIIDVDDVSFQLNQIKDTDTPIEHEERVAELYDVTVREIMKLPDSLEKSILIDSSINKLKGKDISTKHLMNLNTVKTKLRKARKTIKDSILLNNPQFAEVIEYL